MNSYSAIVKNGLWSNNQALVALLGLCPLLAVTNNAINGLALGLATMLVLLLSNTTVSLIRDFVRQEVRLPVFVLIIASFVTVVELSMHAWFFELYGVLGIFIPLIVTNCAIIGRAEAFASKNPVGKSITDALAMGLGFTLALLVLGGMRELIGQGTLFAQADFLFGSMARDWTIEIGHYRGVLIAILPPGAFLGLGFLIALKNLIDQRLSRRQAIAVASEAPSATLTAQS